MNDSIRAEPGDTAAPDPIGGHDGCFTATHPAPAGFRPRTFVLHRHDDIRREVVAWGITLPDGSALFGNTTDRDAWMGHTSSAEQAAALHHANRFWLSE